MATENSNEQALEDSSPPTMRSPKSRRLVIVVLVLSFFGAMFLIYDKLRAPDLFRQYVVNPIPASVSQIKVDHPMKHKGGSYGYVFRFDVNREDFEHIRESRPFREAEEISYVGGEGISWDWKDWDLMKPGGERGSGFSMYALVSKPSWYDLPTWEDPEAYALRQVDENNNKDIQVLLYNSELGQAYFITFHYSGLGL